MNGRVLGVFTCVLLLTGAGVGAAHFTARGTAAVEATMITAANDFVASLDVAGRDKAVRPFDDDARFEWFFTPVECSGLPLKEMTLEQRTAALALLRRATSSQGFQKATGVMRLEEETAPIDILTGNSREARTEGIQGLQVGALTPGQRDLFLRLLAEYVDNVEPGIARARYARMEEVGMDRIHFAWAGSLEPGGPHYYRIHGPTVLIEYDNTQNNANHIHSVWRDLENDFGGDLLRLHYERAGSKHGHGAGG